MTAKELVEEIRSCEGPCGRACANCPDNTYIGELADALENLIDKAEAFDSLVNYAKHLGEKYGS